MIEMDCTCVQKHHSIPTEVIEVSDHAIEKVGDILKDYRRIFMVADDNTYRVAGQRVEEILKEIDSNPLLDGVTFSGGDPFMQPKPLVELAKELKKRNLNVITYTGYRWEELVDANDPDWNALIQASDVIVDGPFVQSLHDWKLKYTGSSNQRIIDVKRTLTQGELVLMADLGHMPSKAE